MLRRSHDQRPEGTSSPLPIIRAPSLSGDGQSAAQTATRTSRSQRHRSRSGSTRSDHGGGGPVGRRVPANWEPVAGARCREVEDRGGHSTPGCGSGLPSARKCSTASATTARIPASAACRSGSSQLTNGKPSHRPTHSPSSSDHSVQFRYSRSVILVLHHVNGLQHLAHLVGRRPALARLQDQHRMIHPRSHMSGGCLCVVAACRSIGRRPREDQPMQRRSDCVSSWLSASHAATSRLRSSRLQYILRNVSHIQ